VLSYRRVGGSDFAQLLKVCFQKVGIDVFLDVDNLGQGQFDEQLWKRINAAKNVVLVWTKGCECRCVVRWKATWCRSRQSGHCLMCRHGPISGRGGHWPTGLCAQGVRACTQAEEEHRAREARGLCVSREKPRSHGRTACVWNERHPVDQRLS